MKFTRSFCKSFIIIAILFCFLSVPAAWAKQETHSFTLYKSPKFTNPYILDFPITVNTEGQIKVTVTVEDFGASNVRYWWSVLIVKKNANKIVVEKKRKTPGQLIALYGVGSPQLRQEKEYIVRLVNFMNIPARGTMTISYPSRAEVQRQQRSTGPCDLAINKIRLSRDCKVMVEVINNGPGTVPHQVWTSKAGASLYLFRNGKKWGGASLKNIDPRRKLQRKGGKALYKSNLKVKRSVRIKAIVDYGNRVKEAREANNSKEVKLKCKGLVKPIKPLRSKMGE